MKNLSKNLILMSVITFCMSVCSQNVFANKVKRLKLTAPQGFENAPVIKVKSLDGEKWSVVDKIHLTNVSTGLSAKCRYESRGNKNYNSEFNVSGFEAVGKTEPSDILIPHSKKASGIFQYINNGQESVNLAKVCNDMLADKVANTPNQKLEPKYRKYVFLSKGLKVNYPNALSARYKLYCGATAGGRGAIKARSVKLNAVVDCQPSVLAKEKLPVEVKQGTFIPLIKKVGFIAKPKQVPGSCKAAVDFDGTITANRAGVVKYQYVSKAGDKSPVFTLNFPGAGSLATNNWNDIVAKPDATKSLSLSGSSKSPDITGWWKLNIISPQSTHTATAKYALNCAAVATIVKPLVKPKRRK